MCKGKVTAIIVNGFMPDGDSCKNGAHIHIGDYIYCFTSEPVTIDGELYGKIE